MNPIVKYVLQFIVLILLQVLVVDQISLGYASQFIIPSIYFLFVLMLPLTVSNGMLMFLAFFIGMMIDVFKSTPGMHASAMVVLGYSRPYLLKLIEPREGFDVFSNLTTHEGENFPIPTLRPTFLDQASGCWDAEKAKLSRAKARRSVYRKGRTTRIGNRTTEVRNKRTLTVSASVGDGACGCFIGAC